MSEDLRNADLSGLSFEQMTPAQRAELRRRYDAFVERLPRGEVRLKNPPSPDLPRWAPRKITRKGLPPSL